MVYLALIAAILDDDLIHRVVIIYKYIINDRKE